MLTGKRTTSNPVRITVQNQELNFPTSIDQSITVYGFDFITAIINGNII